MEKAHLIEQETRTERKKTYEPPKVVFIPLKIEERLMTCGKTFTEECGAGGAGNLRAS